MTKVIFLIVNVLFLGFWFAVPTPEPAASSIPLCHTVATDRDDMAQFALDPAFQALHPSPLLLPDYQALGKMITFKTADGKEANGYLIAAKKKSNKWLFVYQEWWGLNDNIKNESDKFYNDLGGDVNVLALDMYDGQVTSSPAEAGKLMSGVKEQRLIAIVNGGYAYAGKNAKVANVGWCFGGSWSLRSALLGGKNNVGSVIYYGMPVRDVNELKKLNSDVLGLFATEERISKAVIEEFAAAMKTAGKSLDYKIFEGVHGFANPSNPKHDPALTQEAYGMALKYLKSKY